MNRMMEALEARKMLHDGAAEPIGTGLAGEYFDNNNLTALKLTRTEAPINFNWFSSSPDASIAADTFSVRWTGQILAPATAIYTFTAHVDDGVRLWINGALIIDQWVTSAPINRTGSIALTGGGMYDIKLEYREDNGGAQIQLYWQAPALAKELVPKAHLFPAGSPPPVPPPPSPETSVLRLDSGATSSFTDATGKVWLADRNVSGGWTTSGAGDVAGTPDDPLFNSRRFGNFSYAIPIANGSYKVKLLFMDPSSTSVGQRKFDVFAESALVLDDFDILATAGQNTAVVKTVAVTISDGRLDLRLAGVAGNPTLSGIEILSSATAVAPKITWTTRAAAPGIRAEALRAVIDNKLFVFGGFQGNDGPVTRSDVYNPATNAWSAIAPLPERLTHTGVAVVGRDVYFAGGYVGAGPGYTQVFGTKHVWRYNVDQNKYYAMPDLPIERAGGGLVVIGSKLHYFGGDNLSRHDVGDHYVFDLAGGTTWTTTAALPSPRSHLGYVGLNGKIYAIAGQKGNDAGLTTQSTVSVYDPATNQWTDVAPLPKAVSHISSATIVTGDGRIMVLGGETAHNVAVATVYLYDPAKNFWQSITPLPAARFSGVAAFINGRIYFTTGSSTTTTWEGVLS